MIGHLLTGLSHNKEVRVYVAETTQMVAAARDTHDLSPMSTAALGRTLTATVMMGMMSKIEKEKITLQIKGTNAIGLMIAIADSHGNVKAYTSTPHAETIINEEGKLAVGEAVGKDGKLIVIKDFGMKEPFIGQSTLVSGEIAEDIAHYFLQSEQQATAVALGVLLGRESGVKSAGGVIVQLLPGASEETISQLEANLSGMQSVTALFEEGLSIEQIAHQALAGLGLNETERHTLHYKCDCSKEKMERALCSVGEKELKLMAEEDERAEIECHFCHAKYIFTKEELLKMC